MTILAWGASWEGRREGGTRWMIVSQSNKREINQIDRRVGSGNHQGLLENGVEEGSQQREW